MPYSFTFSSWATSVNCVYYLTMMQFGNYMTECNIPDQIHTGAVTLVNFATDNSDHELPLHDASFYDQCSKYNLL